MFKNVVKEQLKVPAHIDYLADLREFVTRIGKKHGFSDRVINAFKLAIDEAGTNVMRHAYRDVGGEGFITIRGMVKANSLTICLIDQGKYFDPKHVKDPDLQRYVDIGKKGGLGIFIMRRLMDEIDYRKTEEGNELRLTKNRDGQADAPQKPGSSFPKMAKAFKSIPFSLKAKYWMRTTLLLFGLIGAVYAYYFWQVPVQATAQFLNEFSNLSNIVASPLNDPQILAGTSGIEMSEAIAKVQALDEVRNTVVEIIYVDATGLVLGHIDKSKRMQEWSLPEARQEVRPGIFVYTLPMPGANGGQIEKEVYDHVISLGGGELHIRALKESLDRRIAVRRWAYARVAGLGFVVSAFGTFLLVYILMNPFRKLADWVRRADHSEIHDEMDIDASTEIGEIAQAFSEITNRFRESQKNLADQERLQKEMQVAQEIQQTLLPSELPELEGYELASYYEAAREVGGDYYDFVEVDKDTLGIAVADVSGKGVPGSLVMTMIRTALRTEARGLKDAAEVLSRVNKFVMNDMKKGMFVTIFYVIIDGKRRRLNYASAGHNPMILYRTTTQRTYYLNPRGFPIGIQLHEEDLFRKSIESDTIQLAEDDILLIYTDGITEAMNAKRDLFGEERLIKIFREHGQLRVKPFVEQIKEEILSFTEGNPQSDDITLVAIREKTSPEKEELRRAKEAHTQILAGKSIREACESVGITTYAYYNKYKREFEERGAENFEIDFDVSVEAKHIAIEDKVKIYDIIKHHPEYGAKRVSEELNTDKYGFTAIAESKIYDELVRSRLNTRQLREAFVARGGRTRRPMKQPGTPMLTLDGKIILDRARQLEAQSAAPRREDNAAERPGKSRVIATMPASPNQRDLPSVPAPATSAPIPAFARSDEASDMRQRKDVVKSDIDVLTLLTSPDELLDKKRNRQNVPALPSKEGFAVAAKLEAPTDEPLKEKTTPEETFISLPPADELRTTDHDAAPPEPVRASGPAKGFEPMVDIPSTIFNGETAKKPPTSMIDISFEDLFAGGTILEERPALSSKPPSHADQPPAEFASLSPPERDFEPEEQSDESSSLFAVDDILRQEMENSYGSSATLIPPAEEMPETFKAKNFSPSTSEADDLLADAFGLMPNETPPQAAGAEPPSESELSYVDVQEILQQEKAESGAAVLNEPPLRDSKTTTPAAALPKRPGMPLYGKIGGNGTSHDGEANFGGPAKTPEEISLARLITPSPASPAKRSGSEAARSHASAGPEHKKEGWNGAGRREDERERMLIAGLRHYKNQRFAEAIAEFEKTIRLYPDFKEAYSILGNAYFRNRMYDAAAKAYARVKEMDPFDTTAYENMGVIHANRGDYVEAMKEWQRVLEIDPGRDDIRKKIERASRMVTRKAVA